MPRYGEFLGTPTSSAQRANFIRVFTLIRGLGSGGAGDRIIAMTITMEGISTVAVAITIGVNWKPQECKQYCASVSRNHSGAAHTD